MARAGRQGSELSLALFDVDDFQSTNRESGREAGDDVLRRVAAVLAESVRLVDTVGRIGGDEFVLVAPGSAGVTVARRVIEGIAALPAVAGRPMSVSAGVARFPVDGSDARDAHRGRRRAALGRAPGSGPRLTSPRPGSSPRARRAAPSAGRGRHALRDDRTVSGRVAPAPARASGRARSRPRPGGRSRLNVAVPVAADREAAERDRHAVAADDPRLVDLAAARRGEVVHRQRQVAGRGRRRRDRSPVPSAGP